MAEMTEAERRGKRKRGFIPSYWWDFDERLTRVLVETDDPRRSGVIAEFHFAGPSAERAIGLAEKYIADLAAGRSLLNGERWAGYATLRRPGDE